MENNIFLRVDGSTTLGWGHVFRCIGLAQELKAHGYQPFFLCRPSLQLKQILAGQNIQLLPLTSTSILNATVNFMRIYHTQTMILDLANSETLAHLKIYASYVRELKKRGASIILFDSVDEEAITNKVDAEHDLVIVPYVGVSQKDFKKTYIAHYLLGPDYYIFRNEILELAKSKNLQKKGRKLLVMLGGGQTANLINKIVRALKELSLSDLAIKFITYSKLPKLALKTDTLNFKAIPMQQDPTSLFQWADTVIIGSGLIKYEIALLGIPSISITTHIKHKEPMDAFVKHESLMHLGYKDHISVNFIMSNLSRVLYDESMRIKLNRNGKKLVDGKGRKRVLKEMKHFGLI